jgi:hypothetical protein
MRPNHLLPEIDPFDDLIRGKSKDIGHDPGRTGRYDGGVDFAGFEIGLDKGDSFRTAEKRMLLADGNIVFGCGHPG